MHLIFIKYYLLFLFSLTLFFSIGEMLFRLLKIQCLPYYTALFGKFLLGLTTFVIIVAICATKGRTILLGLLIPALGLYLSHRKNVSNTLIATSNSIIEDNCKLPHFYLCSLLEIFLISLFIFSVKFYFIYSSYGIPITPHPDLVFNAKNSYYLLTYGIETINLEYIFPKDNNNYPYHYYELWLNAGITFLYKSTSLWNLVLITFPIINLTIWVGLCAIYDSFTPISLTGKVTSALFLLFTGFFLNDFHYLDFLSALGVFARNLFNYPKLGSIYLFLILSILFFTRQKHEKGLYCLLVLPLLFISTAPSILLAVFIYSFIQYFLSIKKKKKFISTALASLTIVSFIALFYYIFGSKGVHLNEATKIDTSLFDTVIVKTAINIFVGTSLQIFILYAPIVIPLFFFFKVNWKVSLIKYNSLWLIPIIYTLSLLSWACLNFMLDAVQLFSNITISLLNISCFIAVVAVNKYLHGIQKAIFTSFIFIMIATSCIYTFKDLNNHLLNSPTYIKTIYQKVKGLNPIGIYIQDKAAYNSVFAKNSNFAALGLYLSSFGSAYHTISLSVFDIPLSANERYYNSEREMVESTTFYKYVQRQKEKSQFNNITQSQIDFIDEYNIDYLIVANSVNLHPLIQEKVKEQIVDPVTKERFLLLK